MIDQFLTLNNLTQEELIYNYTNLSHNENLTWLFPDNWTLPNTSLPVIPIEELKRNLSAKGLHNDGLELMKYFFNSSYEGTSFLFWYFCIFFTWIKHRKYSIKILWVLFIRNDRKGRGWWEWCVIEGEFIKFATCKLSFKNILDIKKATYWQHVIYCEENITLKYLKWENFLLKPLIFKEI